MSKLKVNQLETYDGSVTVNVADLAGGGGSTVVVEDNLASTSAVNALSANQGRVLKELADTKQATLVSGTNIKTINGVSVLGAGDLVISGGGGGTSDHGSLTGLADDDHPQYHTDARGDARYSQLGHDHAGVYSPVGHGHAIADVTGLQTALDGKAAASHTHAISDVTNLQTTLDAKVALTGNQNVAGVKTFTDRTVAKVVNFTEFDAGTSGTTKTIDFANGQKQKLSLTGNVTVTLSFPGAGNYQLILTQDGTGSRTVTWSGVSRYVGSATAPAINTAASTATVVSIYYDGTNAWLAAAKVNA